MNKYLEKIAQYVEFNSTFTHEGVEYDLSSILRESASLPVIQIPVNELSWLLKYDFPNPIRMAKADLSAPILVTRSMGHSSSQNRLVVIDGLHRLAKAVKEGVKTLPAKEVPSRMLHRNSIEKWNGGVEKVAFLRNGKKDSGSKSPKEKPHVERALKKLEKENGVLVDHSVGSGKTRLFLKAVEKAQSRNKDPKARSLIIAPASLVTNVEKEVKKHGLKIDLSKVDVLSYEKAVNDADKLRKNKYLIAVADEAQRLRNTGTVRHKELSEIFQDADKRLLATATPSYNHVSDIAPLVNIVAGYKALPEGKKDFEHEYVNTGKEPVPILKRILGSKPQETHTIKNKDRLSTILNQYVDHYNLENDPIESKHFPQKEEKVFKVPMSKAQMGIYKYYENELPFYLKLKVRSGLALDRRDVAALQLYSQGIRQVSNSARAFMPKHTEISPKISAIVNSVEEKHSKNPNYKGIVYSAYRKAGVDEISRELERRGIKHSVYHGGLSKTQKDAIVDTYNNDKKHVLLITASGAEGLNTKGTRHIVIADQHFNKSRIDQVIGRGTRYKSHDHLPEKDRKVSVEHYISTFPDSIYGSASGHSIEEYLHHSSKTKDDVSQQLRQLLKDHK